MHLHFVPFNPENGKLQARISMNPEKVNMIHDELPEFLRNHGFDVIRGKGKTKDHNIEDVHEYKEVMRKTQALVDEVVTEYLDIKEKVEDVEADLLTLTRKSKKKQKEIESLDTDIEAKTNHAEILAAQNKEMQQRLLKMRRAEESRALRLQQLKALDDAINKQIEKSKQRQQQQRAEFEAQWQAEQKQHAEKREYTIDYGK